MAAFFQILSRSLYIILPSDAAKSRYWNTFREITHGEKGTVSAIEYRKGMWLPCNIRTCSLNPALVQIIFFISWRGVRLTVSPLGTSATNWPIIPAPDVRWVWRIWWNDNWQGKPKYSEKSLSQYHFVHNKSYISWPGTEPGPPSRSLCGPCRIKGK
jgi:hypothetical protein